MRASYWILHCVQNDKQGGSPCLGAILVAREVLNGTVHGDFNPTRCAANNARGRRVRVGRPHSFRHRTAGRNSTCDGDGGGNDHAPAALEFDAEIFRARHRVFYRRCSTCFRARGVSPMPPTRTLRLGIAQRHGDEFLVHSVAQSGARRGRTWADVWTLLSHSAAPNSPRAISVAAPFVV